MKVEKVEVVLKGTASSRRGGSPRQRLPFPRRRKDTIEGVSGSPRHLYWRHLEGSDFWRGNTLFVETPEPGPTRKASPNRNPGTLGLFLFIFRVIKFSFFKNVATRIPGPTRMADPNRIPVYSDIFNYLVKTCSLCYFSLGFRFTRKHFQMVDSQTFTFHKIQLQ